MPSQPTFLTVFGLALLSGALGVTACSGGTPATPAAPAVAPSPPSPLDLSPVPPPAEVLVFGRWSEPARALEAAWLGERVGARAWLESLWPRLGDALRWDVPVELVVLADPEGSAPEQGPYWVVSAGLTTVEAALSAWEACGGTSADPREGARFLEGGSLGGRCAAAPAAGEAAARLVCGPRRQDAELLLPYVTRTVPLQTVPAHERGRASLHLEFRAEAMRRRYGERLHSLGLALLAAALQVESKSDRFDRAYGEAVDAVTRELLAILDDLHVVSVDARIGDAEEPVEIALSATTHARRSWLLGSLFEQAASATSAPGVFWRAPADSERASFFTGLRPERYEVVLAALAGMLESLLAYRGAPQRLGVQAGELVRAAPLPAGRWAYASGRLRSPPGAEAVRPEPPSVRAALGWRLVGIEGSPERYLAYGDALARVYQDPVLGSQLRRLIAEAIGKPLTPLAVRVRDPRPAGLLPRASKLIELQLPAFVEDTEPRERRLGAERGEPVFVVLVPDDGRVWIGLSADELELVERLAAVRNPRGEQATLARRAGIGDLHKVKTFFGGFSTPPALASWLRRLLPAAEGSEALETAAIEPVPIVHFAAADPSAGALLWSARIPASALQQLVSLLAARPEAEPADE